MLTYVCMGALLLFLAGAAVWKLQYAPQKPFFTPQETGCWKGIFCILVLLTHTPGKYDNVIAELLGKFAATGVTFFFLASAYGLKYGVEHKEGYLRQFWRKRLPTVLVPTVLVQVLRLLSDLSSGKPLSFLSVIDLNHWVLVLILLYLVFWLVYTLGDCFRKRSGKNGGSRLAEDLIICGTVLAGSLLTRLTPCKIFDLWSFQSLGFIYGLLLYRMRDTFVAWGRRHWWGKLAGSILSAGLLTLLYLKFGGIFFWGDYLIHLTFHFCVLCTLLVLSLRVSTGNPVSAFLGKISFEYYLLHPLVFSLLERLPVSWNAGVFVLASVAGTALCSAGLYYVDSRILKVLK